MNPSVASASTRFKVGMFTIMGLALIGAVTVFVNDRPFWWRPCELVHISVDDATGLKMKSPVRSLGLQIGYLKSVELSETHVRLGICITAPVEVLPETRAYLRAEGFLGDKFVELKPVKYVGPPPEEDQPASGGKSSRAFERRAPSASLWKWLLPEARAETPPEAEAPKPAETPPVEEPRRAAPPRPGAPSRSRARTSREIPVGEKSQDVQALVTQVDQLVEEMTSLTNNIKEAIRPEELRSTMQQLNKTLENASRTLSPEGGLNTTAQRTLAKLEDAIEQLRDLMTRVNRGEGSVGMLLNDPAYAEDIREAIKNLNRLLTRVGDIQFFVDIGGETLPAYDGSRGWFRLGIWPKRDRYYLLGISLDARGRRTTTTIEDTAGGQKFTHEQTIVEQQGILFTAMIGKVLWRRIDLSIGVLHSDGAFSTSIYFGPRERETMIVLRNDLYTRGSGFGIEDRLVLIAQPLIGHPLLGSLYLKGGLETFNRVNGRAAFLVGAGILFDDEDIKLLFALR